MDVVSGERQAISVSELARKLGVSRDTIRASIRRGELKVLRIGKRGLRILIEDLEAYLAGRRVN